MKRKKIFLLAGEASGDLHGGLLVRSLKKSGQVEEVIGIGGPKMVQEGLKPLFPFADFQIFGFTEVVKAYPRIRKLFYSVADKILSERPDAVVTIDYPGFNLRLASYLKERGFQGKLIHYISPTVWAWGKGRVKQMEQSLDLLLTIFPFEKEYFANSSLPVAYVGNPLIEELSLKPYASNWRELAKIPEDAPLLALFPGSRGSEIEKNLPLQIEAAKLLLSKEPGLCIALSLDPKLPLPNLSRLYRLPHEYRYECMAECKGAIAKCGTTSLELALHATPAVITYPVGIVNYLLAKYLFRIRLPHYAISNILLNETLYPEWIGRALSAEKVAGSLASLWERRELFNEKRAVLHTLLGAQAASVAAADKILEAVC